MSAMALGGSKQATKRHLTTGEAADYLGVSEDVVRSLEGSGELRAVRTPGNHRRFDVSALQALLARWEGGRSRASTAPRPPRVQQLARHRTRVSRPVAGLDPFNQENEALDRDAARAREEDKRQTATMEEAAKRQAAIDARKAEDARIEGLKRHGRDRAGWSFLEAGEMTRVVQDLESFVTSNRFPAWAGDAQARSAVNARVDQMVAAFKARKAQAEEERRDERKRTALVEYGKNYAWSETLRWDSEGRDGARLEVQETLEDEVAVEWTEPMVRGLVDEVLDGWADED